MSCAEIDFIKECDKLKGILRQTSLCDGSRRENSAEHSWHLALAVIAFRDLANFPFNTERALKMALVHDLVEIDAGDTFVYDVAENSNKFERELKCANRIFPILPHLSEELSGLWLAYEKQECPESIYLAALDRFLPLLANCENKGDAWKRHGISKDRILARNSVIDKGSKKLWEIARMKIEDCFAQHMEIQI